jgi:hypothetical protein
MRRMAKGTGPEGIHALVRPQLRDGETIVASVGAFARWYIACLLVVPIGSFVLSQMLAPDRWDRLAGDAGVALGLVGVGLIFAVQNRRARRGQRDGFPTAIYVRFVLTTDRLVFCQPLRDRVALIGSLGLADLRSARTSGPRKPLSGLRLERRDGRTHRRFSVDRTEADAFAAAVAASRR